MEFLTKFYQSLVKVIPMESLPNRQSILFEYLIIFFLGYITKSILFSNKKPKLPRNSAQRNEYMSDSETEEESSLLPNLEPRKMVMVVRTDLKMGKGKIAAQCCHACLGAYRRADERDLRIWALLGQTKLVCKVTSRDALLEVAESAAKNKLPHYLVTDAGRTQIAPGSETVCAIGPAASSLVDKITGDLKLL
eukprot:maker-scaffold_36-snap-gene-2.2-mRNA-1 protein AED:0.01 eAED:0.01 QI:71/1/0.5/1/1/1/2/366/192